jgi:small subunit ribosomal protein S20
VGLLPYEVSGFGILTDPPGSHLSEELPTARAPRCGGRTAASPPDPTDQHDEEPVANIKSQIKRNRQTVKRQARNKAVRSELRTRTKRAVSAIEEGAENSDEALRLAIKRIDKAAAKGVIHKNQAANRKSRLMRRAASASADA